MKEMSALQIRRPKWRRGTIIKTGGTSCQSFCELSIQYITPSIYLVKSKEQWGDITAHFFFFILRYTSCEHDFNELTRNEFI